jgi:uncharacterized protein (TIGR03643 family)
MGLAAKMNADGKSVSRIGSMNEQQRDRIIRMAWEDRTTFDEIREKTGYAEADVIKLMRKEMKPSSFRMWRRRVSGRATKHRKPFQSAQSVAKRGKISLPED